jgi:PhnB protein
MPKPDGYNNVMPYLVVADINVLIDFLQKTYGAEEIMKIEGEQGSHAEVRIGDTIVMIGSGPQVTSTEAALYTYVDDVDATLERALAAGGVAFERPADQEYGDRRAGVRDPSATAGGSLPV